MSRTIKKGMRAVIDRADKHWFGWGPADVRASYQRNPSEFGVRDLYKKKPPPYPYKGELHRPRCPLCHFGKLDGNRRDNRDRRLGLHAPRHEWLADQLASYFANTYYIDDDDDFCTTCGSCQTVGYVCYRCAGAVEPAGIVGGMVDDGPDAIWRMLAWWDDNRPDWAGRPLRLPFIHVVRIA